MGKTVLLVQFTHPGDEHLLTHQETASHLKLWNYGPHRRKYLKAKGQYIEAGHLSTEHDLLFWGEWEPTSEPLNVTRVSGTGVMPTYIHIPFLQKTGGNLMLPPFKNKNGRNRQNTDPFVFGDSFFYCCCKQRKRMKGSDQTVFTKMGYLERGSIILFGSTISPKKGGPYFALDTVFVVGDYLDYTDNQADRCLNGFTSQEYRDIMGFHNWSGNQFVCYKGTSFNNPYNGMFSFVPCKVSSSTDIGYPRVKLTNKDLHFISNNLNAAPKYSLFHSFTPQQCWSHVCQIVRAQGFELGVHFNYEYR